MLPEDLSRLLAIHDAAAPTGNGLHPRLLAALTAKREAQHGAPQPDAALPGAERMAGGPPRPSAAQALAAVRDGAATPFPTLTAAAGRRRA